MFTKKYRSGASVNARGSPKQLTPLMYAIDRGDVSMVQLLLQAGADKTPSWSGMVCAVAYCVAVCSFA